MLWQDILLTHFTQNISKKPENRVRAPKGPHPVFGESASNSLLEPIEMCVTSVTHKNEFEIYRAPQAGLPILTNCL
jgi:hypothetical protein